MTGELMTEPCEEALSPSLGLTHYDLLTLVKEISVVCASASRQAVYQLQKRNSWAHDFCYNTVVITPWPQWWKLGQQGGQQLAFLVLVEQGQQDL